MKNLPTRWLHIFFLITIAPACSTVRVRVAVMRPAEVTLPGTKTLMIGEITGPSSDSVARQIKHAVATSPFITLVDQSVSKEGAGSRGPEGPVVLTGQVTLQHVTENTWKSEDYCQPGNQSSNKQRCIYHYREAIADAELAIAISNANTGAVIFGKSVTCRERAQTQYTEYRNSATPLAFVDSLVDLARAIRGTYSVNRAPAIDHDAVLRQCDPSLATEVLHVVSPWSEKIVVQLQKDRRLPQLKQGILFVKAGDWELAIAQFQDAQKAAERMTSLPAKTKAKVYWDLGVAYLYNARFDEADAFIHHAFALTANPTYKKMLNHVSLMRHEHEMLQEQITESHSALQ